MTVAKGLTNSQDERNTTISGFNDLIQVVADAKLKNEAFIKARLYDIIINSEDSYEEKKSQSNPLENSLSKIEETNIRIRRVILIGLYSFWEISLKELCDYYNIQLKKEPHNQINEGNKRINAKTSHAKLGASDYLYSLLDEVISYKTELINNNIRELRNYFTHGTLNEKRKVAINYLIVNHPEFGVRNSSEPYLSSYEGLKNIKELIESSLNKIEGNLKLIK